MAFRSRSYKLTRLGNIVTAGRVRKTGQPAFRVTANAATTAQTGTIPWDTEYYDIGGNFDLANNRFVAPVDGLYNFEHQNLAGSNGNLNNDIGIYVNGAFRSGTRVREDTGSSNWNTYVTFALLDLNENDYVDVRVITGQVYNNSFTWICFQGYLVG